MTCRTSLFCRIFNWCSHSKHLLHGEDHYRVNEWLWGKSQRFKITISVANVLTKTFSCILCVVSLLFEKPSQNFFTTISLLWLKNNWLCNEKTQVILKTNWFYRFLGCYVTVLLISYDWFTQLLLLHHV